MEARPRGDMRREIEDGGKKAKGVQLDGPEGRAREVSPELRVGHVTRRGVTRT